MNDPSPSSRHIERLLVPTLALLFAVALVPFASVHPLPRLVLGSMGALVGAAAVWVGLRGRSLAWPGLVGLLLLLLALALNATSLWPIDAATREGMQPVVAGPVNAVLALVGQPVHSLALDPARALGAVQLSLGVGLAGLGVLALVRSLDRARGFAWILVTAGVLTTVLATLHWATGATSIYWISGVPSYARDPFFAPFVSPNQGGAACAALIPLALALMLRKDLGWRLAAMGAAAVLVMGVAASGSRGAILEAVVAGVVFGLLLGSRTVQLLVGLALAAGLGALIHHGPYALAYRFSTWISPDWFDGDLLLGRGGIWHATARLAGGAPLLGVGAGSYEDAYQIVKTMPEFTTTSHAHQDYLQALAEQGLVGGGAWILLALLPVIAGTLGCLRLHRGRRRSLLAGYVAALVALLVCAAVDFPAHIGALAVLYALLAGVSLARAGRSLQPRAGRGLGWSGRLTRLLAPALALVALLIGGLQLRAGGDPSSPWAPPDRALALGREAFERAKADPADIDSLLEAEDWFRVALARRPVDPVTLYELARTHWLAGELDRAGELLELSTQAYPTLVWSWLHLARLRRAQREDGLARQAYAHLLALDLPSDQSSRPYLREVLLTGDDPERIFTEVLPPRADRLRDAAQVAFELELDELAEDYFRQAMALDPEAAVPYASFLLRRYRYDEALTLVQDKHDSCFANRTAGSTLLAMGRYDESLARYLEAQALCGSDDVGIRMGIASARLGTGDAAGLRALEQLVVDYPQEHLVRRSLMAALRERGRFEELRVHLEQLQDAGVITEHELRTLEALQAGRSGRSLVPRSPSTDP
jgi:tetratricopeptide (TPR) repeat protein/O-antigen ligase